MSIVNLNLSNAKIDFMGLRFFTFGITIFMVFGTIIGILLGKLEYGIDFKGGNLLEVRFNQQVEVSDVRQKLGKAFVGDTIIQEVGSDKKDIIIKIGEQPGLSIHDVKANVISILGDSVEFRRIENVGPKVGKALLTDGIYAVISSLIAMLIYVWFRFEWQFGVAAIVSLVHDCVSVVGLYVVTGIEFNITAIVAILITAGYSINDTVVIYDRIRDNIRGVKDASIFKDLINKSINETLSRTILTSSTTLLALFVLYFFGGEVIASYSLPIIVGIGIGTYSSIFFAAPLLLYLNPKGLLKANAQ